MSHITIKDLSDNRNLNEADMATVTGGWLQVPGLDGAAPMIQPDIAYSLPTAESVFEQLGGFTLPPVDPVCKGDSELEDCGHC